MPRNDGPQYPGGRRCFPATPSPAHPGPRAALNCTTRLETALLLPVAYAAAHLLRLPALLFPLAAGQEGDAAHRIEMAKVARVVSSFSMTAPLHPLHPLWIMEQL